MQSLVRSRGGQVSITDHTWDVEDISEGVGAAASVAVRVNSNGALEYNLFDGAGWIVVSGEWLVDGVAADYKVKATLTSGTNPDSGTMGTFQNCGTTRTWQVDVTRAIIGTTSQTSTFTLEFQRESDSAPMDSASITLSATATRLN